MKRGKRLLKDVAYEKIKEKILKGEDTYTSENSLVESLGMSRTPIREALHRLEHEGFIQIISNQGIVIPDLSVKDRIELTEMRIAIETYSLKQVAKLIGKDDFVNLEQIICKQKKANEQNKLFDFLKYDAEFHQYFLEIVGNTMFVSMYQNIRERLFTVRESKNIINRSDILDRLIKEHEDILSTLKNKEFNLTIQKMEKHINGGKENYYI